MPNTAEPDSSPVRAADRAVAAVQDVAALIRQAAAARSANEPQRAEEALSRAVELALNERSDAARPAAFLVSRFLFESGRLDECEEFVRKALLKWPRDFPLLNLRALTLKRQGKLEAAILAFKRAQKFHPRASALFLNQGNTYLQMDQPAQAAEMFARLVALEPKSAESHRLLGVARRRAGDLEGALSSFLAAVAANPRDSRSLRDLASMLSDLGRHSEAVDAVERSLAIDPASRENGEAKAILLRRAGRGDECRTYLEAILSRNPETAWAHYQMARLLHSDREKANDYARAAHKLEPNNLVYLAELVDGLNRSRHGDEGAHIQEAYELALELHQKCKGKDLLANSKVLRDTILRCGDFEVVDQISTFEELGQYWATHRQPAALHLHLGRVKTPEHRRLLVDYHRMWGQEIEKIAAQTPIRRVARSTRRSKIRVGIMSSDLRNHPVSYFALPLLEGYDRKRFEFYCYSYNSGKGDRIQDHIAKTVDVFRLKPGIADRDAAQMIADDDLDILFELGGTTFMNKIEVMPFKPAPLGASWLGYPHSCGLASIDYILVDPFINPPDPALLIEKPFLLEHSWVVLGRLGFDEREYIDPATPEERNGRITFGTMNNPYKFTPEMLAVWAKIVSQVDNSRFLFVRPEGGTPAFREHMRRAFAAGGVSPDRVEFVAVRGAHRPHYNQIDIALDTFPQTGGTTTCETLWMGVPVVTLVGEAFFERLSYSNLSNAGLADLCAFDIESYIQTALALAADRARRKHLRQSLRHDLRALPLGNVKDFVEDFQNAVERAVSAAR